MLVDQHNPAMADIETALSKSLARDGRGGMLAPLNLGNQRIVGVAAGVADTDAATVAQIGNTRYFRVDYIIPSGTSQSRFPATGDFPFVYDQQTLLPLIGTSVITDRTSYSFDATTKAVVFATPITGPTVVAFFSALLGAPMVNTGRGTISIADNGGSPSNPNNTSAMQVTMAKAALDRLVIKEDPSKQYKMDGITGLPGIAGIVGLNYAPIDNAVAGGIRFPSQAGCYADGRDAQTTFPRDMFFENLFADARQQPFQSLVFQNAQNIKIYGMRVINHGNKAGASTGAGLRNGNGLVIDVSSYRLGSVQASNILIEDYDFDCTPTGTLSAANYGTGIGINCGGEAVPFPYTGPDYLGTVRTEVAISGLARAEAFYRQFGLAIPTYKTLGVRIGKGKVKNAYYGLDMTGVDGFDLYNNVLTRNIRAIDSSNGNLNGRIRGNKMLEYSSVGVLGSYENRNMELTGNYYRSSRVAGAAAIYGIHGVYNWDIHGEDILTVRNVEAGNPDGVNGAIAKCCIAIGGDVVGLSIHDNQLRGVTGIGHIGLSSAFVNSSSAAPLHFGTNGGTNMELMSHVDSTGISIQRNAFYGAADNASPAIRLTQITDTGGAWALNPDLISANAIENNAFGGEYLHSEAMTAGKIVIDRLVGNSWIEGATPANISLVKTTVNTRTGNVGDEGIVTLPEYSFDAIKDRFLGSPGIGEAFVHDAVGGARFVYRRGGVLYNRSDNSVTAIQSAYTAATSVQTTRAAGSNVIKRATGASGVWPSGERGNTTYTLSQRPGAEVYNHSADEYGFGFTGDSTKNGSLAQCQASLVKITTGEIVSVVGGATNPYQGSGVFVGEGEFWWGWLETDGKKFQIRTSGGKSGTAVTVAVTTDPAPFYDNLGAATTTVYPTFSINTGQINVTYSGVYP